MVAIEVKSTLFAPPIICQDPGNNEESVIFSNRDFARYGVAAAFAPFGCMALAVKHQFNKDSVRVTCEFCQTDLSRRLK